MASTARKVLRFITDLLRVQPGEGRKTGLMFGIMMCVVGTFIMGRIARDSLFLSRYSIDYLPFMYIWTALGVSVQSYLYSRVTDRFRRDRLFQYTLGLFICLFLGARVALELVGDWFYPVLYVMVELVGSMLIIQAWTLANEIFDTREAKRLFGLVGAGGVVSSVIVGFGIRGSVKYIGTENLLFLCAGTLVICLIMSTRLSKVCMQELLATLAGARREMRTRMAILPDLKRIFSNRHLIYVAGLVCALVFVMTYVDWQFKIAARYAYLNREAQLAGFFGLFYGLTGVFNVFVQGLATSRILERFGILVSLLLLPIALTTGAVCWLILPALWSASVMKGADATLRYTINDATVQLLYLPVPSHTRGRAKAFIDGIVRPVSIALAGVSIAWLVPLLPERAFGVIVLLVLGAWIGMATLVRKEYLTSLVSTLRSRRLDFDLETSLIPDQAAAQALRKALEDEDDQNVMHALEMIPFTSRTDWGEPLVKLTRHPAARIRAMAVRLLGEHGSLQHGPVIYTCLRDDDPAVVANAIDAYCTIGKERAVRPMTSFLEHPDNMVRSAAVVGLIRYGGLDGVLSSAERLKALLESNEAEERATGARILGKIQVKNFYHPLLELMADEHLEVRLAAIQASGRMRSPELLPALIYRLESPETRIAAGEALATMGKAAVPLLKRVLANPEEGPATREAVPNILARIGDQSATDVLQEQLPQVEPKLRSRILEAIHRLRIRRPHLNIDQTKIEQALMAELETLYEHAFVERDLALEPDSLLADAWRQRRVQTIERIFRLLGCLYPVRSIDAVYANLSSAQPRLRANALEVVDNILGKDWKRLLLPTLDPSLRDDLEELGQQSFGLRHLTRLERLVALIHGPDPWLSVCAMQEAGRSDEQTLVDDIMEKTAAEQPLLRETALVALAQLVPTESLRNTAERHLRDPSRQVRAMAAWLTQQAQPA